MSSVNRAFLRNLTRLYADGRPGGTNAFVVDSDATANAVSLDTLINSCALELFDLFVAARGHEYYESDADLSLGPGLGVGGSSTLYTLPTDFYQLLSLRLYWDANTIEEMHQMGVRERSRYERQINTFERGTPKAFRLRGTQAASARTVEILPAPTVTVTANVRYIPTFQPLTDDTTTMDVVNGGDDLIALKAAIKYRTVAEKPLGNLPQLYAECHTRISQMADQRAANFAEQLQQVYPERRRRSIGGAGSGFGIFDDTFGEQFG
jgi:hypothetical protein